MKKILCTAFILAGLMSCKKEMQKVESSPSSPERMIQSAIEEASTVELEDGDMEVAIRSDYVKTKYGEFKGAFNVIGRVVGANCNGELKVNTYRVPIDNNIFYGDSEVEEGLKGFSNQIFGNVVNFRLSGSSSFYDFNEDLYVPSLMNVRLTDYSEIHRGALFGINWTPDLDCNTPVYVLFQYNPEALANEGMRESNPDMITKMFSFDQHSGYGEIEPADLESLPDGGKIDVYVGRGNAMLRGSNGHNLHFMAVHITTVRGLLMN